MRRTILILIGVLLLASASCAKRDWVGDLLVLADVTGTWEGWVKGAEYGGAFPTPSDPILMVLQQTGPKVSGQLSWSRGQGRVEGVVAGEILIFNEGIRIELAVDGDEMWGRAEDRLFASTLMCRPWLAAADQRGRVKPPSA